MVVFGQPRAVLKSPLARFGGHGLVARCRWEGDARGALRAKTAGTFVAGNSRRQPGRRGPTEFVGGSSPARKAEDASLLLEVERREAYLVVASGSRRAAEFTLRETLYLGRDESADVVIDDESASRRHAAIEKREDGYYLRDLGSANGTYLNGLLHAKQARLREGDRFRIGQTEFLFHDDTQDEEDRS